ncbi:ATP-binding cassette transporter [Penicillium pulvis]|uniref:ATP-binding cassette transporter n=1 Tax=Penicillium pulvis TaxID=1562058 RepID=UPI0025468FBA|nr:ATP-binding cassette transporter [Penicillium pulvis]KAJ5813483.1 ATP-binding cassette transporter [Penicillium pulvis]
MFRGGLTSLIHHHSLNISATRSEDSEALTLVGSDVDSIESAGEIFHETWAQLLEVIVGTVMLAARVRWLAFLPLVIIIVCSRMSAYVANHLEGKQKNWNVATQKRIATITSALSGIKSLKMLGMEDAIKSQILNLRSQELHISQGLRWILVAYNASANALGIFAPVVTLMLYAMTSRNDGSMQANEVFSSLALLAMVTHPANMIMTLVPRAVAVMANFTRVQAYLTKPSMEDNRQCESEGDVHRLTSMNHVTIKPASMAHPILRDVSLDLGRGELLLCVGSVGSGKSTLALALLGELHLTSGTIRVQSKQIAYCAQKAWLPSGTICDAISGEAVGLNLEWYNTVVDACGLLPDLEALPDGDKTMIENNGINLSGGQKQRIALARAVYSRNKILVLDDPFSALDKDVREHVIQRLLGSGGLFKQMDMTVFLISNLATLHPFADRVLSLRDSMAYLQRPLSRKGPEASTVLSSSRTSPGASLANSKAPKGSIERAEVNHDATNLPQRTGDLAVYGFYLNAVGRLSALFMTFCTATYSFALTFSTYILKWAVEAPLKDLHMYLGFYVAISGIAWIATNGTMWSTHLKIAIRSGEVLHAQLLGTILRAPLAYFTDTQIGVTLNRFSQDISLVDKQLPPALANLSVQIFKLLAQVVLILSVQPLMTATVPICFICVYFIQRVYLRTSKQLRYLDLESKSHVYTDMLDTVNGATTIRAFGWQRKFEHKFDKALNLSQKPSYLLLCLQCWLKVVLDCLIALIAISLIAVSILYRDTTTGADIGLALNLIIVANGTLLKLVQSWASLETSLGAVSRLKSVQDSVSVEDEVNVSNPGPRWPLSGETLVDKISVSYSSSSGLALRNMSLRIDGGQNVIITGRTGSGKSTLMLSLLKLLATKEGLITIDGVDIAQISSNAVRQRGIIAVPQDGFNIPTATLRFNLDPYHMSSEKTIIEALKKTRLWDKLTSVSTDEFHGNSETFTKILDLPMSCFLPLSAGQLQLFALCRMLLRIWSMAATKPIIILDEASSSLDLETESILREILVKDLCTHTVVMIAHHVDGIITAMRPGHDKNVAIQDGRVLTESLIGNVLVDV